jgi:hypothetical protein
MEDFLRGLFSGNGNGNNSPPPPPSEGNSNNNPPPTPPSEGSNNNNNASSFPAAGAVPPAAAGVAFVFMPDFLLASMMFASGGMDAASRAMAASMESAQPSGPPPASTRALQQLPLISVTTHDLVEPVNRECCICLGENELHQRVLRLPCAHIFHPQCAKQWLTKHNTCPVCRYELPTDCPHYERGRLERMRHRKPRFAKHELARLSVRELKELLKRTSHETNNNNNNNNNKSDHRGHPFFDKNDLIDYLIQSNVIDLIPAPPPVEYSYKTLKEMSITRLKECMNEAGVFFSKEDVVEKDDLLRLFLMSGRLNVLSDEDMEEKQTETVENEAKKDGKLSASKDPTVHLHKTTRSLDPRVETVMEDSDDEEATLHQDQRRDTSVLMEETNGSATHQGDHHQTSNSDVAKQDTVFQQEDEHNQHKEEKHGTVTLNGVHDNNAETASDDSDNREPNESTQEYARQNGDCNVHSESDNNLFSRKRQRISSHTFSSTSSETRTDESNEEGDNEGGADNHSNGLASDIPMNEEELEILQRFQVLSISQLQALARECSVDTSNCLEKNDIIDRLVASDEARNPSNTFSDWGCGEMRALASLVDVDLSNSNCRQQMVDTLQGEVHRRPYAGRYLLALAPLARLTTQQLRAVAREWLVNVADCLERGEIIHRLVHAAQNREQA